MAYVIQPSFVSSRISVSIHSLYQSDIVYVIQLQSISSSYSLCHPFAVYGMTTQDHVSMYSQAPRIQCVSQHNHADNVCSQTIQERKSKAICNLLCRHSQPWHLPMSRCLQWIHLAKYPCRLSSARHPRHISSDLPQRRLARREWKACPTQMQGRSGTLRLMPPRVRGRQQGLRTTLMLKVLPSLFPPLPLLFPPPPPPLPLLLPCCYHHCSTNPTPTPAHNIQGIEVLLHET